MNQERLDRMVDIIVETLAARRGLLLTDSVIVERARNIATALMFEFEEPRCSVVKGEISDEPPPIKGGSDDERLEGIIR